MKIEIASLALAMTWFTEYLRVELATGKVTVIRRQGGSFLIRWAYKSRDWMVRVIEHTLPEKHSAVLKGIMLGDKESLPSEVQESFLRTGTGQPVPVQLG